MRLAHSLLLVCLFAAIAAANDGAAALADRLAQPPELQWRYYYVSTAAGADDVERNCQAVALRLIIPSVSRQPVLQRCLPTQIGPTLYRLDLAELRWSLDDWKRLIADYPYHPAGSTHPLVVRADWLLVHLTDANESDAYYRLLFGTVPKTRDEALAALGVDGAPELRFGLIEKESGVSKAKVRWIENRPISRGYAWGTRDSVKITAESDPLEHPAGDFKHDGEEWIIGIPKVHLGDAQHPNGIRGALQVYFLASGAGALVDRAPVDLVEDASLFRGLREIRNMGSCIGCHGSGLNFPTSNELRETLSGGTVAFTVGAYHGVATNEQLEAFHFSDVEREIRRNNEDFAAIVSLATGCEPEEAALAYQAVIETYDAPVDQRRAAVEHELPVEELPLAIGWANAGGLDLGPRFPALAHGGTLPRTAFEQRYQITRSIVDQWRLLP